MCVKLSDFFKVSITNLQNPVCYLLCVRATPVRQEGGTAPRTTVRRLSAGERLPADDAAVEAVPARPGPSSRGGLPVHLDAAVQGEISQGGSGGHGHLPNTDSGTGERGSAVMHAALIITHFLSTLIGAVNKHICMYIFYNLSVS